jgi:glyoxylase-like metal-dependent hydrolase (beta-lactamase superfamily II)
MKESASAVPSGPLEVRDSCWIVGLRNPFSLLQCNTYIRRFEGGREPVHICIDPGSRFDFPIVEKNISSLVGDLDGVAAFTLNHQDPDVVGNAPALCEANPNVSAIMTEEVWRLAQHLNFKPRRVHFANAIRSRLMTIADSHRWELVPTPFCHFRGAIAFYDPDLRTLFSGDLFGGLNRPGRVQLFGEELDWAGIAQFHQIYMPTREGLRLAVRAIRALKPAVEVIAPQHGFVLKGDLVGIFLERMEQLLVGLDLMAAGEENVHLEGYRAVLGHLLARAAETMGRAEVCSRLRDPSGSDDLERLLKVRGDDVRLESDGYTALVKVFARLARGESVRFANVLRDEVLAACTERGLPIPPVGVGLEEELPGTAIGGGGIHMQPRTIPS